MSNARRHRFALPAGYRLLWYEIDSVLGQGGFGITYLARDTNLDHWVAIKEFLPSDLASRTHDSQVEPISDGHTDTYGWGLQRFVTEAKTLVKFRHPNIVLIYNVFEANNTAYMVMEYVNGRTLEDALKFRKVEGEDGLKRVILSLMDGLELIHDAGFIHRDIKPDNIYLRETGSPVLLDFGSARQALGGRTRTLTALVSPGYAPYEQYDSSAAGEAKQGPWTDIYALGATLYRAVSGKGPVDAMARVNAAMEGEDPYLPAIRIGQGAYSEEFLRAIDWALELKPRDRPQSIAKWRAVLTGDHKPDAVTVMAGSLPPVPEPPGVGTTAPATPDPVKPATVESRPTAADPPLRSGPPASGTGTSDVDSTPDTKTPSLAPATRMPDVADSVDTAPVTRPTPEPAAPARAAKSSTRPPPTGTIRPGAPRSATAAFAAVALVVLAGAIYLGGAMLGDRTADAPAIVASAESGQAAGRENSVSAETGQRNDAVPAAAETQPEKDATAEHRAAEIDKARAAEEEREEKVKQLLATSREAADRREFDRAADFLAQAGAIDAGSGRVTEAMAALEREKQAFETEQKREAEAAARAATETEKKDQIRTLLAKADEDLRALRLTTPPGANALERFRKVLQIDSGNAQAEAGILKIGEKYVEMARQALAQSAFDKAKTNLDKAEEVVPGWERVSMARDELQTARNEAERAKAEQARVEKLAAEAAAKREAERAALSQLDTVSTGPEPKPQAQPSPAVAASAAPAASTAAKRRVAVLPFWGWSPYDPYTDIRDQWLARLVHHVVVQDGRLELGFSSYRQSAPYGTDIGVNRIWQPAGGSTAPRDEELAQIGSALKADALLLFQYRLAGRDREIMSDLTAFVYDVPNKKRISVSDNVGSVEMAGGETKASAMIRTALAQYLGTP